jgi:galactose mutarotase-like enzyme
MFNIREYLDDGLKIYELMDTASNSYMRVVPERGGIITELGINGQEILYLNRETLLDKKANIRGGIPILFPISGQLQNGNYKLNGKTFQMKNHGFARNLAWEVVDTNTDHELSITIRLKSNDETRKSYPFEFEVIFKYILKADTLLIEQDYKNHSSEEMPIYAGFHPYFKTSQKKFDLETDAEKFLDYNDEQVKGFTGTIDLSNKKESLMLIDPKKNEVEFTLPEIGRVYLEYGREFKYIVCWTEQEKDFVCVEPWMAKTFEFNQQEELFYIESGKSLKTFFSIKVN